VNQPSTVAAQPSASQTIRARRRTREKEARRRSILDAARAVFLEWGMSASTMDQIAERAELSKGALYLHFSGKQELCLALLVEVSRSLVDVLKAAHNPKLTPLRQLERLIDAYYGFYLHRPDYFRLLFVVEHQSYRSDAADALRTEWTDLGREALELLASVIEAGVEQGSIRSCAPWTTAVSLWASVTVVIVLPVQEIRAGFVGNVSHEELVKFTLRTFWRGIQAEAAPAADDGDAKPRGKVASKPKRAPARR